MTESSRSWQRARRPEQKEQRRASILSAAARLLDEQGVEGTGLNAIARAVGIAKANIYRYFESREAVLLELVLEEQKEWLREYVARLVPLAGSDDIEAVADAFAVTIAARPRFCILVAAQASVLERNIGAELVTAFKRTVNERLEPVIAALTVAIEGLSAERARRFLVLQIMTASGAWPHCNPAPVVQEVLARAEFAALRFDFEGIMREHAAALLRGLLHER